MDVKIPDQAYSPGEGSLTTPRRVSFFDVGGLLDESRSRFSSTSKSDVKSMGSTSEPVEHDLEAQQQQQQQHPGNRRGTATLQDVGGLLSTPTSRIHRFYSPIRSPMSPVSPVSPTASSGPEDRDWQAGSHSAGHSNDQSGGLDHERRPRTSSLQDVGGLLDEPPAKSKR